MASPLYDFTVNAKLIQERIPAYIKGVLTGTREKRDGQKGAPGRREMVKNKQGDGQFRAGRQGKCARRRELNSHVYIHDGVTRLRHDSNSKTHRAHYDSHS